MSNTLALVHQLGGTPMTVRGPEVVASVAAFVKEYGVTHVLLGRTKRPWYRRLFGRSILERLLQEVPHVDVTVVGSA